MQHFVGTSGFQYKNWAKRFYPPLVPQKQWLEYYATRFNTVEINNSFYRLPLEKTFAGWAGRTPPHFRFAIKGSQYVTHRLRLKDPAPHVKLFFDRAQALEDKLAVVLWQLPANLLFDADRLEAFTAALRADPVGRATKQALEVRHDSWFCDQSYDILRRHDIAMVVAHSKQWPYRDDVVTGDHLYVRFHGAPRLYASNYSKSSLQDWATSLTDLAAGRPIYAYFNNDANVHAPDNAAQLADFLDNKA